MNGTLLKSEGRSVTTESEDVVAVTDQRGVLATLDVTGLPQTKAEAEAALVAAEEAEEGVAEAEAALAVAEEAAEGTLTLSIEARDPASGKYVPLTAFAATKKAKEAAAITLAFTLYPGASETAAVGNHEVMALALPRKFRVKVTHSAAGGWTYSVGVSPLQ